MAGIEVEKRNSYGVAAIFAVVWALVLIIFFLLNRGIDIGQLGQLIESSFVGAIFGFNVLDSLIGGLAAGLIVISWFGLGSLIAAQIAVTRQPGDSHLLEIALQTAVGAAVWSLMWFLAGLVNAYAVWPAILATVVGIASAIGSLWKLKRRINNESRVPERAGRFDLILAALIGLPVLLALVASLAPPTAKDTLLYHFAVPKAFIAQGNGAFIEGNIASYLALGTEMHVVWAMLVGGAYSPRAAGAAAGAVTWAFYPLLIVVVFGWARELKIDRTGALIASLMVAAVPSAFYVAANGYTDVGLSLFIGLAVYSVTRWWKDGEIGWAICGAIFLGAALSAKLTTIFVIAAIALVVLLRIRKESEAESSHVRKVLVGGFGALILAGVIASPWYLRTWRQTGSPVFPFYMSIWPGEAPGWDVQRSNLFQAMNSHYGGEERSAVDMIASPWNVSILAQPEIAKYFDGVLGVSFLLTLPFLIWAFCKFDLSTSVKISAGVAAMMFAFWLFSSQQLRYLLPITPLLAVAGIAAADEIGIRSSIFRQSLRSAVAFACVAGLLTSIAWYLQKGPTRVVLGGESGDQYLSRNLDYYPYYQVLNSASDRTGKVWLINMRRDTFNLDRPVVSDYLFEDITFRQMLWNSSSVEDLRTAVKSLGVSDVMARHDLWFDYATSTLVDDDKPRNVNEAKLKIAREFIFDPSRMVKADEKFSLIKVF